MKNLIILIVLILTLVFPAYADDLQDGEDAYFKGDYKTAFEKFKLLAEQGDAKAQSNLGEMYFTGQGAAQDYLQAHMWFNLAYANGRNAGRTYRKLIEEQITSDQIEEAWKLVREWKAKRK